jgi:hypothetical protein
MGYCVNIEIQNVVIPADKVEECEKALQQATDMKGNLVELFEEFRFDVIEERESGDIIIDGFLGEKMNWKDEDIWRAIAPFVQSSDDATIVYHGEDGGHWGYKFKGGKLIMGEAKMEWDE